MCSLRKMCKVFPRCLTTSLLDDVDEVNEVGDVHLLVLFTVLDEQGDVEVNWCDLL